MGKSQLVWVHKENSILQLKQKIWGLMGYPVPIQHLVSGHSSLQDCRLLKDYAIKIEMTISLNLHLRGGATNQGTSRSTGGDKEKKPNS